MECEALSVGRTRKIKKRCQSGVFVEDISLEELLAQTHLPSGKAAKQLGLGITVFKKCCRRRGLKRWPYQKPSSRHFETTDDDSMRSHEAIPSSKPPSSCQFDPHHGKLDLLVSAAEMEWGSQGAVGPLLPQPSLLPASAAVAAGDGEQHWAAEVGPAVPPELVHLAQALTSHPHVARQLAEAMCALRTSQEQQQQPLSAAATHPTSAFAAAARTQRAAHEQQAGAATAALSLQHLHNADSLRSAGSAFLPYALAGGLPGALQRAALVPSSPSPVMAVEPVLAAASPGSTPPGEWACHPWERQQQQPVSVPLMPPPPQPRHSAPNPHAYPAAADPQGGAHALTLAPLHMLPPLPAPTGPSPRPTTAQHAQHTPPAPADQVPGYVARQLAQAQAHLAPPGQDQLRRLRQLVWARDLLLWRIEEERQFLAQEECGRYAAAGQQAQHAWQAQQGAGGPDTHQGQWAQQAVPKQAQQGASEAEAHPRQWENAARQHADWADVMRRAAPATSPCFPSARSAC